MPGTWWHGIPAEEKLKIYPCTVNRYKAKHKFEKGTHQCWFIQPDEEEDEFECGYYDICHFLDRDDRPHDYVDSEDENCDRGHISDSEGEETEDTDEDDPPSKKKKKIAKRKERVEQTKDRVSHVEGHFNYAVPSSDLPPDQAKIRRTVEAHAGVYKKTLPADHANAGKPGYLVEPVGWRTTPDPTVAAVNECASNGHKLVKEYTEAEKHAWTIYDSWLLTHPQTARECAVENTQIYYENAEILGKSTVLNNSKWPEEGFQESHYIGYCAIMMLMGLVHVPCMEFYWNTDDRANFNLLRSIMPRDTFKLFRRFMHFSDPQHKVGRGDRSQPPPEGYDIIYNWREMQDHFNEAWSSLVTVSKWLAFDEMMIKLSMNTALSRRQPNKPIRDGIQCYSVAESKGKWCYVSWIDCGKLDNAFKGPYAHGWISDMVLHVLLNLGLSIIDKYHIIAFDQYFSSPILFALLFNIGIYAVGTCQTNRRGFPQRILSRYLF